MLILVYDLSAFLDRRGANLGMLRSDQVILVAVELLNHYVGAGTFGVRDLGRVSGYDKNTVSYAIRRLREAGFLQRRRGPGLHYTYTVTALPPDTLRTYYPLIESRIK
jgi:DNA-binding MarR family transcriptional regulator